MSRTYTKKEVEEILRRAAQSTAEAQDERSQDSGLSIEDLVEIGTESGLDPAEIVRAAQGLDQGDSRTYQQTLLGMDISASHSVRLPGRITDEEWRSLVSDCRKTFYAKGNVVETGPLKEWSNGNLHVTTEPEGDDTLLTFRTHRSAAASLLGAAGSALFITLMMSTRLWSGEFLEGGFFVMLGMLGTTSIVLALMGTLGTKRWARTRKEQMQQLAARAGARRAEETGKEKASVVEALPQAEPRISLESEPLQEEPSEERITARHRER